jgi:alpha-tubulin suppressor-like RCC1 family protein
MNQYLSDKWIIDICYGSYHNKTNNEEVYARGLNKYGQIGKSGDDVHNVY